ncbi:Parkinson disease protein 7 homolog [Planococcus citri]|uniref:Parkinson disease protein 7 homolog n=1 Tax=Planococcus citri TaxID=170843 RepID=UPI0031F9DA19
MRDVKDNDYDIVVLPGGPGTQKLKASQEVKELLQKQEMNDRWIAAICDAPTVLKAHGIDKGKTVTSFPDVKDEMTKDGDYRYSEESVVVDGKLITSRSLDPETAFYLGLTIIEELVGTGTRDRVAQGFL